MPELSQKQKDMIVKGLKSLRFDMVREYKKNGAPMNLEELEVAKKSLEDIKEVEDTIRLMGGDVD